ncbi:MAG: PEP-CTERM sorting domain-containing protein [Pirellulales bacterium]
MNSRRFYWQVMGTLAVACLLGHQVAQAQRAITFDNYSAIEGTATQDGELPVDANPTHSGVSDYSAAGLNLGTAGYWFYNFNATAPVTGAAPESNDRRSLPSWVGIDLDPNSADYTFPGPGNGRPQAFSEGGNQLWSDMTLPSGESGLSGSVVAPESDGDSGNIFNSIVLGPGTPNSFLWSIVLDNTGADFGDYDFSKRLKVRAKTGGGDEVNLRLNKLQDVDDAPDVYTFRFDNWEAGDLLRLQVRSSAGHPAGIAGMMFDVVIPEPSSIVLSLLGLVGLISCGRRRRS